MVQTGCVSVAQGECCATFSFSKSNNHEANHAYGAGAGGRCPPVGVGASPELSQQTHSHRDGLSRWWSAGQHACLLSDKLQAELGQPIVVDYKPGAGGAVAAQDVMKAPMAIR